MTPERYAKLQAHAKAGAHAVATLADVDELRAALVHAEKERDEARRAWNGGTAEEKLDALRAEIAAVREELDEAHAVQRVDGRVLKRQKYVGVSVDPAAPVTEATENMLRVWAAGEEGGFERAMVRGLLASLDRARGAGPLRNDGFQDP